MHLFIYLSICSYFISKVTNRFLTYSVDDYNDNTFFLLSLIAKVYKGNHGFLNTLDSQAALFIASGPAFKTGYASADSFNSVDIYNLMCDVLSISPAPNNGTFANVEPLLTTCSSGRVSTSMTNIFILLALHVYTFLY